MEWIQLIVLSIVQGITEFLPISSSGHLILVPYFTDWPDQGLTIDIATHIGTLLAVVIYFREDSWRLLRGSGDILFRRSSQESRLFLLICLATLPVVGAGLLVKIFLVDYLREVLIIAISMIFFGLVLGFADKLRPQTREFDQIGWREALWIGCAQVLALIPGTSRSGITMTMGRVLGFSRTASARFSMLLAIPTTLAASLLVMRSAVRVPEGVDWNDVFISIGLSFFAAYVALALMMTWLRRASFMIFVVYRVILGSFLLFLILGSGPL